MLLEEHKKKTIDDTFRVQESNFNIFAIKNNWIEKGGESEHEVSDWFCV